MRMRQHKRDVALVRQYPHPAMDHWQQIHVRQEFEAEPRAERNK